VATRIGLDDLTPPPLAAARFLIAALIQTIDVDA